MEVDLKMKTKCNYQSENRLTALSQNGYVSHYWYDADGERDKSRPCVTQHRHSSAHDISDAVRLGGFC